MWIRQWKNYSCGAAVLQKAVKHLIGTSLSHGDAIALTDCKPEGTFFDVVLRRLKGYGISSRRVYKRMSSITKLLGSGDILLIDDMKTYRNGHFSVIMGETHSHYRVYDPVWGFSVRRTKAYVLDAATELYALAKGSPKRTITGRSVKGVRKKSRVRIVRTVARKK